MNDGMVVIVRYSDRPEVEMAAELSDKLNTPQYLDHYDMSDNVCGITLVTVR